MDETDDAPGAATMGKGWEACALVTMVGQLHGYSFVSIPQRIQLNCS